MEQSCTSADTFARRVGNATGDPPCAPARSSCGRWTAPAGPVLAASVLFDAASEPCCGCLPWPLRSVQGGAGGFLLRRDKCLDQPPSRPRPTEGPARPRIHICAVAAGATKGISETSYAAKRGLLRSIPASKITIEWDMPRDRIRAACRLAPVPEQDRRHSHVAFAREDGNPLADALGDRCITVS